MKIISLKKIKDLERKKVFLRVDFNVPMENGKIVDDYKIVRSLETINYLLKKRAIVIIATHLGRPQGKNDGQYSTAPLAARLEELLGQEVSFIPDWQSEEGRCQINKAKAETVFMLENLRFQAAEEEDDKDFAQSLADLADVYVNNAFAVSHRAHASVHAIQYLLPSYAGLLLEEEIENLQRVKKPKQPLVAILGGAKIKTKVPILKQMQSKAKYVLVGGALANDFIAARGLEVGNSLVDTDSLPLAKKIKGKNIILPLDFIVQYPDGNEEEVAIRPFDGVQKDDVILDIGPETINLFSKYIKQAQTLVWNGPLGKFEEPRFRQGTIAIAREVALKSDGREYGVVGGGETVQALEIAQGQEHIDWISTAGGAMLAYLGGQKMPGLLKIVKR